MKLKSKMHLSTGNFQIVFWQMVIINDADIKLENITCKDLKWMTMSTQQLLCLQTNTYGSLKNLTPVLWGWEIFPIVLHMHTHITHWQATHTTHVCIHTKHTDHTHTITNIHVHVPHNTHTKHTQHIQNRLVKETWLMTSSQPLALLVLDTCL